jgi:hypothetical protein
MIRNQAKSVAAFRALGRLKIGTRNGTEIAYENEVLTPRLHSGSIIWYKFEGMKFRLADNTFYTPDYIILDRDGYMEAHEVKGFWTDDARVKIKVAASQFPVAFIAVRRIGKAKGGGWDIERF